MGRDKVLIRCAECGQLVPLTRDSPDSALVELGPPSRLAGALSRFWRVWRG